MAVYNGAEFLQSAIDTILAQTEPDFEFLILDDCSTDEVPAILESQTDPRIRILKSPTNQGLAAGLNTLISESRADLIARMDGDDLALPERFKLQADFLEANPEIAAVGSAFTIYSNEKSTDVSLKRRPEKPAELRVLTQIATQVCHPASMYRRTAALEIGGYRPRIGIAEDFEFWLRLTEKHQVANLSPVLHRLRWHDNRVSNARLGQQVGFSKLAVMLAAERRIAGSDSLDYLTDEEIRGLWEGIVPEPKKTDPALAKRIKHEWDRINYWHDPRFPEQGLIKRIRKWPGDLEAWRILATLAKVRLRWRLSPIEFQIPDADGKVLKQGKGEI